MKNRKILIIVAVMIFVQCFMSATNIVYGYETQKQIRELKTGDIIYFDNSATNWDTVRIYFFSNTGGNEVFSWYSTPEMTKIEGTNIYMYEITSDLNIENFKVNHVIFTNGGYSEQTIDLGFIETGYAYIADNTNTQGKKYGYWYVYDKTELVELIKEAKKYTEDAEYYESATYEELSNQIINAENVVNGIVKVETDNESGYYYTRFEIALENLTNAIDNLVVSKEKLENIVNEDINEELYESDSIQEYINVRKKAEELLNKDNVTVDEIKQIESEIEAAKEKFVKKSVETEPNPDTGDNITMFSTVFAIAMIGLISTITIKEKGYQK